MQKKQSKSVSKFHVFLVLGVLWIIVLVTLMVLQNKSLPPIENQTIKAFENALLSVNTRSKARADEPITPLPNSVDLDSKKVVLGFKLFVDTKLSHDNSLSCETCHHLNHGGVDNLPLSFGINHTVGERNSPTVFNSGFNFRQFWDGRVITLEEQIDGPTHNPKEMGSSWKEILQKLSDTPEYQTLFSEIYGKQTITANDVCDAIATFERALITSNSRFDRWLKGDDSALSHRQKEGYKLFKSYGCISCHHGVNVGGTMFEHLGIFTDYYKDHPEKMVDLGRFNLTGEHKSRHEFKVPSLRNIALTAPYLHDGSVESLREVIELMALYQLGEKLTDSQKEAIEDFLGTLTGNIPDVLK